MSTATHPRTQALRAFGVIRVSRVKNDMALSPADQRKRMTDYCEREGISLVDVEEELDVSGGSKLVKRPALHRAVQMIESDEIDVVLVAYFDRLVRSLKVQEEIVTRVDAAGKAMKKKKGIVTLDFGAVSYDTASQWLSAVLVGTVAEYHRRASGERNQSAKADAVARGIAPFPHLPPPLRKGADRRIEVDPVLQPIIEHAFEMRVQTPPATLAEIRSYLRDNGVKLSIQSLTQLFASRLLIGELRFGDYVNKNIPVAINPALWRRAQKVRVQSGRHAKSDCLLARQSVLYCSSCGSRLVIRTTYRPDGKRYVSYGCSSRGFRDCPKQVAIAAHAVEEHVKNETVRLLESFQGHASAADKQDAAKERYDQAKAELDNAVEAFSVLDNVQSAQEKLASLQGAVDEAWFEYEELRRTSASSSFALPSDRDKVTVEEWRRLIRLAIERVDVLPGRGAVADRARIVPRLQPVV